MKLIVQELAHVGQSVLRSSSGFRQELETVFIDQLVPEGHLLRKVIAILDTEFIRKKIANLYSDRGRPAIDPVVLFKMLLLSYLFGIRSERRVVHLSRKAKDVPQEVVDRSVERHLAAIDADREAAGKNPFDFAGHRT